MRTNVPAFIIGIVGVLTACDTLVQRPETLRYQTDERFVVAHQQRNERQGITELVPKGETVDDWTEMITIQVFNKAANDLPPVEQMMDQVHVDLEAQRTSKNGAVHWAVLDQRQDDVTYEWSSRGCDGLPDQHEIARFMDGRYTCFRIAYTARGRSMPTDQRDEWLERIASARIEEL